MREATDAFNVCRIEREDFEADDLIATYARQAAAEGATVTIVSSDKDLMQLISDRISMWDPIKQKPIGEAEVREKFGVGPEKVVEVQALIGDSVDNVPGVPGIGPKTAAELITTYGDLESVLQHAPEIKQPKRRQALIDHAEAARMSKKLVVLDDKVPMTVPLDDLAVKPIDRGKHHAFPARAGLSRAAQSRRKQARQCRGQYGSPNRGARSRVACARTTARVEKGGTAARIAARAAAGKSAHGREALRARSGHRGARAMDCRRAAAGFCRGEHRGQRVRSRARRADWRRLGAIARPRRYIPLGHYVGDGPDALALAAQTKALKQIPLREAMAKLKPLFEDDGVLKIGHDVKFDAGIFAHHDIALAPIDSSLLISFVLDAGVHGHELDELAMLHFQHDMMKYKDVAGTGKSAIGFAAVPLEKARDYAAEKADFALRLHTLLKPRLLARRLLAFYETIERPLVGSSPTWKPRASASIAPSSAA